MALSVEDQDADLKLEPETALAAQHDAGLLALGRMSDAEFTSQVKALKNGLARLDHIIDEVLIEGVDYDVPKWMQRQGEKPKKNLLLPGAEKLAFMLRMVPGYEFTRSAGDGREHPAVHYGVMCMLHLGSLAGPVVATGVGSANSHEVKYRYRTAERVCPMCNRDGTIRRSQFADKATGKKGWYCHAKSGGCGVQFDVDDERITQQQPGSVSNPDPLDLDNTILKMAKTRALRDAVKSGTAGSGRLTQDAEDLRPGGATTSKAEVVEEDSYPEAKAAGEARKQLLDALWDAARRAKLKKVGDIVKEAGALFGPDVSIAKLDDMANEQVALMVDHLNALAELERERS